MSSYSSPAAFTLPIVDEILLATPTLVNLSLSAGATPPPRILLLYCSLRERSYSRLLTEEAARILTRLGVETRIFNPQGLPLPDSVPADHPKVIELRELSNWSEGQEIGRASCRERVWKYVSILVIAVSLNKNNLHGDK